jgi:hypothetical protein
LRRNDFRMRKATGTDRRNRSLAHLTTIIVADYIALCHDPIRRLPRWLKEPTFKSSHTSIARISHRHQHVHTQSEGEPLGYGNRFCTDPLRQLQSGMDAARRERISDSVPAGSGTGPSQHDGLRSLRAEGYGSGTLGSGSEPPFDFSAEFAAVRSEFASRIAVARNCLPSWLAKATIRRLLNEQILAMRSVSERQQAALRLRAPRPPEPCVRSPAGEATRPDA